MNKKSIILAISLTMGSSAVLAQSAEDRWNALPEHTQERIEQRIAKAEELGYDMSTAEGRQEFRDTMKQRRIDRAAEMGFDVTTEEGREAFREHRNETRELIREQIQALSEEEKAQLREDMQDLSRAERREFLRSQFGG